MKLARILSVLCIAAMEASAQAPPVSESKVDTVAIVTNEKLPSDLAVDSEDVYWVSDAGTTIKKVSKAGGVPITLVTGRTIGQILVDQANIFFTVLGEIRRVSKNGGAGVTLVKSDLIGYQNFPMVVDQANLYYYEEVGAAPGKVVKNPLLRKVSKSGGVPITLSSNTYAPVGLATDGANLYWVDYFGRIAKKIGANGGRAVTLRHCIRPIDFVIDSTGIYCITLTSNKLTLKKAGLPAVTLSGTHNDYSDRKFVLDGMNLYTISEYKGLYGIYRIGPNARPELLVELEPNLKEFAVDETYIYWTTAGQGKVMRLRK